MATHTQRVAAITGGRTRRGYARLTGPKTPQTDAPVLGAALAVEVTVHLDGTMDLRMDRATAATVLRTLADQATEYDAQYRQGRHLSGDRSRLGWRLRGSAGHRLRTVCDAATAADHDAGVRTVTYDLD